MHALFKNLKTVLLLEFVIVFKMCYINALNARMNKWHAQFKHENIG